MHTTVSHEILLDATKTIAIYASFDYLSLCNHLLVDVIIHCLTYLGSS